jgi:hypothetical protein
MDTAGDRADRRGVSRGAVGAALHRFADPTQVDKFGLLIIALLALIWLVTLAIGGGGGFPALGFHAPR